MRRFFLTAPRWQRILVFGAWFGAWMFVMGYVNAPDDLPAVPRVGVALLGAVVGGVLFGVLMGWFSTRQAAEHRRATEGTNPSEERLATRAAWRGPIPADPVVRQAAYRVVEAQLRQVRKWFWPSVALWLGATALGISLAIGGSRVGWTTVIFLGFLAYQLWLPRHLTTRSVLLAQEGPSRTP